MKDLAGLKRIGYSTTKASFLEQIGDTVSVNWLDGKVSAASGNNGTKIYAESADGTVSGGGFINPEWHVYSRGSFDALEALESDNAERYWYLEYLDGRTLVSDQPFNIFVQDASEHGRLQGADFIRVAGLKYGDKGNMFGEVISDPYKPEDGNEFEWLGLTYKVIVKNGLAWLDRNLGASRAATASNDAQSYGDLYQWGRLRDDHQKRASGTTTTQSTTDNPNNDGKFIITHSDWRNPQNDNLWQGAGGINNPTPPGWRIPTETELDTERASWATQNAAGAFGSTLKFPVSGYRGSSSGSILDVGSTGYYWSSTVSGSSARGLYFFNIIASIGSFTRASGRSVRCVRDLP